MYTRKKGLTQVRTYAHTDGPDGRAGVQMCLQTDGLQRAYAHVCIHIQVDFSKLEVKLEKKTWLLI